jgi:hypothetical protein
VGDADVHPAEVTQWPSLRSIPARVTGPGSGSFFPLGV